MAPCRQTRQGAAELGSSRQLNSIGNSNSFFCGDQTIPCKGGNKAEAQNHVEANIVNSKQTKEGKDSKKSPIEEKKNKEKSEESNEEVSATKQQFERRKKVNYAAKKCGATVEGNNPEADNVNFVITTNKDEYLVNLCATSNKWFVIKLCETIYVKEIRAGSFELFSSQPQNFSVDVSERFPAKDYYSLGVFQLAESRMLQTFQMKKGHNFPVKYVNVEMLTHYGKEHYCPLTFFKVYGIPVNDDDQDWDWDNTEASHYDEKEVTNHTRNLVFWYMKDLYRMYVQNVLSFKEDAEECHPNESKPSTACANIANDANNASFSEKTTAERNTKIFLILLTVLFLVASACILNSLYNLFDRREEGTSAETSAQRLETLQFAADSTSGTSTLQSREESNNQRGTRGTVETLAQRPESVQSEFASTSSESISSPPNASHNSEFNIERALQEEKYDVLLLHSINDRVMAKELKHQLTRIPISDTRLLDVILMEEFLPEVQSEILTMEYVFQKCQYLFVLVTSNLKNDRVKRFQGELALLDSIENGYDGVIPVWAEQGAKKLIFELKTFKGIDYLQKEINVQMIKRLFQRHHL